MWLTLCRQSKFSIYHSRDFCARKSHDIIKVGGARFLLRLIVLVSLYEQNKHG